MKFVPSTGWEAGVAELGRRLATELATGKHVLWIVSGGSNIASSVQIMATLPTEHTYLLSVMLGDERYGAANHPDSNWQQLMAAGFQPGQAKLLPVLQVDQDFDATAKHYEKMAKDAFSHNDSVIAQLGIGEDGHIAGILPNSPATNDTPNLVVAYQSEHYHRLSLSFNALRKISAAYTFAFGEAKKYTIQQLQKEERSIADQPAQILKELPEAYLYSDQLEAA